MVKQFLEIIFGILPPTGEASDIMRWRYRMALCSVAQSVALVVLAFAVASAFGAVSGYPGFASEDTVRNVERRLDNIEVQSVEQLLLSKRALWCRAIASGDSSGKVYYAARVNELLHQHAELAPAQRFRLPGCDEL